MLPFDSAYRERKPRKLPAELSAVPLQRYVVMHEWAHNLKTITMGFPVSP